MASGADDTANHRLHDIELVNIECMDCHDAGSVDVLTSKRHEPDGGQQLLFPLESYPPWYITFLYAFQQVIGTIGGPVTASFIIRDIVCAGNDVRFLSELIGTSVFMCGLCTFTQVTFGIRLPIIQGSSITYVPILVSMMSRPEWKCPSLNDTSTTPNDNTTTPFKSTNVNSEHLWGPRMMEASGALILASLVQLLLGCTGCIGLMMRLVGPLTIAPTVALIGFALVRTIILLCSHQWGVALLTAAVFIIVSICLKNFYIPFISYNKIKGFFTIKGYPLFRLFPQLVAIAVGWTACWVLTETNQLPTDPGTVGYRARTDGKTQFIADSSWIYIPYPGQWGAPTFSVGVFFGMLTVTICSIIESVGDYSATARSCNLPLPPTHAINRGIAVEGLGSIVCGLLGAAHATSSYSQTIGFVSLTGMGSRITWQVAGVMIMLAGLLGKFGAILTAIPDPVLGGSMIVTFGMVLSVGLSNLQFVDLRSSRNFIVLGTAIMMGILIPTFSFENPDIIDTGFPNLDQTVKILLDNCIFIGGITGFLLDNLLPGSPKERGLAEMREATLGIADLHPDHPDHPDIYNLPGFRKCFPSNSSSEHCCSYIPFLPSYTDRQCSGCFRCKRASRNVTL